MFRTFRTFLVPPLLNFTDPHRDDVFTLHVEVGAQDFVAVAFDASEEGDAVVGLDVPAAGGEEE